MSVFHEEITQLGKALRYHAWGSIINFAGWLFLFIFTKTMHLSLAFFAMMMFQVILMFLVAKTLKGRNK